MVVNRGIGAIILSALLLTGCGHTDNSVNTPSTPPTTHAGSGSGGVLSLP